VRVKSLVKATVVVAFFVSCKVARGGSWLFVIVVIVGGVHLLWFFFVFGIGYGIVFIIF